MGGGTSKNGGVQNKNQLRANMLLLGAPSVGKSTIFRQMKLLYRNGFTEKERKRARIELRRNLIASLLKLDEVALELGLNLSSNDAEEAVTKLKLALQEYEYDERDDENAVEAQADDEMGEAENEDPPFPNVDTKVVFADPSIQQAFKHVTDPDFKLANDDVAGRELIQTALPYVLNNIERIVEQEFIPTDADILHIRRHTTNVERISFPCELTVRNKLETVSCTCTDIGGQAQEQTKWEEHAANMDFLLYVSSMADFDRTLPDGTNCLEMQFKLLNQVLRAKCFSKANVIVLLNKSDALEEKLKYHELKEYFSDFIGENNSKDAQQYFQEKCQFYLDLCNQEEGISSQRQVQVVSTCALDSEMVNNVLTKALAASMCSTLLSYGLIA